MLREALVCGLALTLLGGCDRPEWEQESPPGPATAPGSGMTPTPPSKPLHPLGPLLPLAFQLDCSKIGDGERPASVYINISTPITNFSEESFSVRVDSDELCETHDIAANPEAPALAIRCSPMLQLMDYDTYDPNCRYDTIQVSVCSPGFEGYSEQLMNHSSCDYEREQPSCPALRAGDAMSYPYTTIVYELIPKPEGSGASCGVAPETLLADDPTFGCPCFEDE